MFGERGSNKEAGGESIKSEQGPPLRRSRICVMFGSLSGKSWGVDLGFLTEQESGSLRINSMILHVVGEDTFQPAEARSIEHEEFFIGRILDTNVAVVHSFMPESRTKATLEKIAGGLEEFEKGTQDLSRDFSRLHVGTSKEGAFFIFELLCDDPTVKLYSLIKYDYREVIEQFDNDKGEVLLRRIVQAFISDKKAIQKSALVRLRDGVAEKDISALDRAKTPPDIGDYFANFLGVSRIRTNRELTFAAVQVLQDVLVSCQDSLPDRDVPRALRHAKSVLRDRQEITEAAIAEAILAAAGNPEDEPARLKLEKRVTRTIRTKKLTGLVFKPDRQVLRRPPLRRVMTTEGVTIIYPDAADGEVVSRQLKPGGGETITIETAQVTEDRIVGENSRGATR